MQDGKGRGAKTESGPTKAEIAVAFIEELEKGRNNKSKKHTLNDLIVRKRQTTSEDKKK